jgi:hypothetical protein
MTQRSCQNAEQSMKLALEACQQYARKAQSVIENSDDAFLGQHFTNGNNVTRALVAGRFNNTPIGDPETDDLAIGVPGEEIEVVLEGAVNVLFGSVDGITADGSLFLHESLLPGGSAESSAFGARLAAGRINEGAGTRDSLIIGAPFASEYGITAAGRVWVLPSVGGHVSQDRADSRWLTPQYAAWPAGTADGFGTQLAVGDFNGDGYNDLAVGIPNSDATDTNAGIVQVIYQSVFLFVDGFDG